MNDNILSLVLLTILLVATLLGLALTGYGVLNVIDTRKSKSWPTVHGENTRSVMTEKLDDDSRTRYNLHVDYDYTIDCSRFTDKQYKGDRIEFCLPTTIGSGGVCAYKHEAGKLTVLDDALIWMT